MPPERKYVPVASWMTIYEDELEPDNEKPVTVQTATSEAHELLKKEIAAATADEPEAQQDGAGERSGDFSVQKIL